jgi:hypothetical protein
MDDQFLADLETELDMSVDSSASWLEDLIERIDLDEDDYETLQTIIANLYDCSEFIRSELGMGSEESDLDDEEDDDDDYDDEEYDPHFPTLLEDEDDRIAFVGTWDSIRFLEDENGEVTGIQVDFA